MEYLLFLQQLRESAPTIINEAILFVSEFMGGTGALAVIALVYWCISKHAGSFMLLNFSSAYMVNQTLKNIFCVSRPFLQDSRLHPYTEATGYSFPSGHTMLGTAVYSSAAIWQKNRKWFVGVCIVLTCSLPLAVTGLVCILLRTLLSVFWFPWQWFSASSICSAGWIKCPARIFLFLSSAFSGPQFF